VGPALIALGTLARSIASLVTLYQLLAGAQAAAGLGGAAAGAGGAAAAAGGITAGGAAAALAGGVGITLGTANVAKNTVGDWAAEVLAGVGLEQKEQVVPSWVPRQVAELADAAGLMPRLWRYEDEAPMDTGPSPEVEAMLARGAPGQMDYAGAVRDEYLTAMTNAAESEASLSAESWVTEFEATMTAYDSTMESIGLGGGTALKAGFMYAAEDAGSEFLLSIARQLAPELVPYVMEAMAARNATLGPVG
jgi:hypothetical protein